VIRNRINTGVSAPPRIAARREFLIIARKSAVTCR
jgi:hypothetical protein